jgi:hypothetical protein
VVHEDLAHELSRDGKEMSAIFKMSRSLILQAQKRFMNESGSLQSVPGPFVTQITMRLAAQLTVDQRH